MFDIEKRLIFQLIVPPLCDVIAQEVQESVGVEVAGAGGQAQDKDSSSRNKTTSQANRKRWAALG